MAEPDSIGQESDSTRRHFEEAIGLVAPVLDLVLAAGDRISRIVEPVDYDHYPIRDPDAGDDPGSADRPEGSSSL